MHISRVVIHNYRCLGGSDVVFNDSLNIIVGNNECGKTTLLEAMYLGLTGTLNGRTLSAELHPHLFNSIAVDAFLADLRDGKNPEPPTIFIELYFGGDDVPAFVRGTNNSRSEDASGVCLSITFDEAYKEEYAAYISKPNEVRSLPIEYYSVQWRSFAGNDITARSIPFKPSFIDASAIRNAALANRYIIEILKGNLDPKQIADLSLSYRLMRDRFLNDDRVTAINAALEAKKGTISDKALSVSLDTTSRSSWEVGVVPHLDEIPLPLVGKGEQNSVKIKLALESAADAHIVMIEEAENHLSYSNLNILIAHIAEKLGDRQLLLTTHSSFVLNKLGVDSVLMFSGGKAESLKSLSSETEAYFRKLPGHDTLRLILSARSILVEGPSDELIVQRAFFKKHGKTPLEAGVDVITVNSLAFRRFLEIARLLGRRVDVVTDNDAKVAALKDKYNDYADDLYIRIQYDDDEAFPTLEPQLLKANGRAKVNQILGKNFATDDELLAYMKANKTECALQFLDTEIEWSVPEYIQRAVEQ